MKLITLNIWGGIVYEPLLELIKKYSTEVDVFCFQEVLFGEVPSFTEVNKARISIFNEISEILVNFNAYKRITDAEYFSSEPISFGVGQVIFVNKNLSIKNSGEFYCYDSLPEGTIHGAKMTGSLGWVELESNGESVLVVNVHGLWQKGFNKIDTPERIVQSEKIKNFLENKNGKKILCGDFNLVPQGKSIGILEENMKNLVKEYEIESTRSSFYEKFYGEKDKFGDYVFTSKNIQVKDFKALQDEVSDHLPLLLEFE